MGKLTTPLVMRDFHIGRYSPNNVGDFLCPENSVADCLNVNFDEILGHISVRGGQHMLTPDGGLAFGSDVTDAAIGQGGFPTAGAILAKAGVETYLAGISAVTPPDNTVIYYNARFGDQLWHASNYSVSVGGAFLPLRFAQLNGSMFVVQSTIPMYESADGQTWTKNGNCIPESIKPTLVYRFQGRLLAAGDPAYPSRIWVSSVIDLNADPFITWNIDPIDGDWIDVNPDDGGNIVGFSEASTFLLIFKNTGMYRTDDITNSATPDNIYNVGAVSQENITICQGVVYFYTGFDIRSTDGGYPVIVSRAGVQDILADPSYDGLCMGSDGVNVWASSRGVVLKYSTRDQSWTVHGYTNFEVFAFVPGVQDSPISAICMATDHSGYSYWMLMEDGYTDGACDIAESTVQGVTYDYYAITQDVEFGSKAHQKSLSDKMVVYVLNGASSSLFIVDSNGDYSCPIPDSMVLPVTILADIQSSGFFFNFWWGGTSAEAVAVFQGLEIEEVTDEGINAGANSV